MLTVLFYDRCQLNAHLIPGWFPVFACQPLLEMMGVEVRDDWVVPEPVPEPEAKTVRDDWRMAWWSPGFPG